MYLAGGLVDRPGRERSALLTMVSPPTSLTVLSAVVVSEDRGTLSSLSTVVAGVGGVKSEAGGWVNLQSTSCDIGRASTSLIGESGEAGAGTELWKCDFVG